MVVIGIAAILAGIAAPDFSGWLKDNRVEAVASQTRGFLDAARSEAISRGALARVKFDNDTLTACIIPNLTANCRESTGDTPTQHMNWDSKNVTIGSNGAIATGITFDARGRIIPRQNAILLTFCDNRGKTSGLVLTLNQIGRSAINRLSEGSENKCL